MRSQRLGLWSLLLGASAGGVWWITSRREEVAAVEGKKAKPRKERAREK
jgi:hypothetical protein